MAAAPWPEPTGSTAAVGPDANDPAAAAAHGTARPDTMIFVLEIQKGCFLPGPGLRGEKEFIRNPVFCQETGGSL